MHKTEKMKNALSIIVIISVAALIVAILAGGFLNMDPMYLLAGLATLAATTVVYSLDIIHRAVKAQKNEHHILILIAIFILLAYPFKDISLYLLQIGGVFYVWVDEILIKYFYTSYLVSGAIFNWAIRT